MNISAKDFRLQNSKTVKLKDWPTIIKPYYESKKQYQQYLNENIKELSALQRMFYASDSHAVLLIFQGMDCAGKDGVIRHVLSGINPEGCEVHSFKAPSTQELKHDFLWRTTGCLPERGRIGVFNRSYYEEVLIVRVHPELLLGEGFNAESSQDKMFWKNRYQSIVNFEEHLYHNQTKVLKFYLHLSQDEQKKRFLERIDQPDKNWKLTIADIREREYWPTYTKVYEECLAETSTKNTPWYIIPADDKDNARLIVSHIILKAFKELNLEYPKASAAHAQELKTIRDQLLKTT